MSETFEYTDFEYTDEQAIRSSAIKYVLWNANNKELYVEFRATASANGNAYIYSGVSSYDYNKFINSSSLGAAFRNDISGKYDSRKVTVSTFREVDHKMDAEYTVPENTNDYNGYSTTTTMFADIFTDTNVEDAPKYTYLVRFRMGDYHGNYTIKAINDVEAVAKFEEIAAPLALDDATAAVVVAVGRNIE